MKIYCAHSSSFDFKNDFYAVLEKGFGNSHDLIFPHLSKDILSSREVIKSSGLVIAEISYPSTGLGVELGWAEAFGTPILALHRVDCQPSQSIRYVANDIIAYKDSDEFIKSVKKYLAESFTSMKLPTS